jgi:hypothetical protein
MAKTMARIFQGLFIGFAAVLWALCCAAADTNANTPSPNAIGGGDNSAQASMSITPLRCVALHQGQVCYQEATLMWSSASAGDYCVYVNADDQPLQCWRAQTQGSLTYEFASAESQIFQLKNAQQQVVAEASIEVAWVYKSNTRRKTHWRLF